MKFYIFDLVILLTFSYYCTQFKMIRIQHNTMRSRNINMRHIVAVALVVFIMETQNVAGKFWKYSIWFIVLQYVTKRIIIGTLRWGQCTGLRLDNSVSSFTASDCVSMGGKCCDLGQLSKSINKNDLIELLHPCSSDWRCYFHHVNIKWLRAT